VIESVDTVSALTHPLVLRTGYSLSQDVSDAANDFVFDQVIAKRSITSVSTPRCLPKAAYLAFFVLKGGWDAQFSRPTSPHHRASPA
jgi:hypothetical protein